MKVIHIDQQAWSRGIDLLHDRYRLFGPVKPTDKDFHEFQALSKGMNPDMDYVISRTSPKSVVFPPTETIFKYSLDPQDPEARILKEVSRTRDVPRAVIGIRPCDAKAFVLVQPNFDNPDYQDPYWVKAYAATTFVGLACADPRKLPLSTCFCTATGCSPFHEEGLDILLVRMEDDGYMAKLLTEKGVALADAAGWDQAAPNGIEDQLETMGKAAAARITSQVATDRLKDLDLLALHGAPFWDDLAFACINCGTCTYVCPTCWCFDIQDETCGHQGVRIRNWDSCMYPLFTLHGSGHNPRGQKVQRVRQRFMHKLKYYVDKYDNGVQCVGCGRCVRLCPVNIDIRRVCNIMNAYDPDCACKAA